MGVHHHNCHWCIAPPTHWEEVHHGDILAESESPLSHLATSSADKKSGYVIWRKW